MEAYFRPTRAEIDINKLRHNIRAFRQAAPAQVKLSVCVKANGYGHGAVTVSRVAAEEGADYLNVAFLDEAIQIRQSGNNTPILVLGYTPPEGIPTAFCHDITLNVYSLEVIEALEQLAPGLSANHSGRKLKVHVKIDSGMGRLGIRSVEEAVAYVRRLSAIEGVEVEGLFTHFACADEADKSYTTMQHSRFRAVVEALDAASLRPAIVHVSNSAAAIDLLEYGYDMIRVGVSLYGLYPSTEVDQQRIELQPILSLKTKVIHAKKMPAHEAISYGAHYHTGDAEWIATIPIGYADGYSRMMSGSVEVLIRGKRVPVVGRICMDQCMVSLLPLGEEAASVTVGEEVVLIGTQGDASIRIDELADKLGTIHYEVACMLAHRVPRVYIEDEQICSTVNPLWN
ncbi:alanine racemase [Paenibacillus marinisediminis]